MLRVVGSPMRDRVALANSKPANKNLSIGRKPVQLVLLVHLAPKNSSLRQLHFLFALFEWNGFAVSCPYINKYQD